MLRQINKFGSYRVRSKFLNEREEIGRIIDSRGLGRASATPNRSVRYISSKKNVRSVSLSSRCTQVQTLEQYGSDESITYLEEKAWDQCLVYCLFLFVL
jgi:hypothetical protein